MIYIRIKQIIYIYFTSMTGSGVKTDLVQDSAQLLQEQGWAILKPYWSGYHGYGFKGSGSKGG